MTDTEDLVGLPWRCDVTGNPYGTDTWAIGYTCQCQGCRAAARLQSPQARVAELEGAPGFIAEAHDAGRHDGLPEPCPAHDADTMFAIATAALAQKDAP